MTERQLRELDRGDIVVVGCESDGCANKNTLTAGAASANINRNGKFICRSCSYTEEGKRKIAAATSYKRSDKTKQRMSEAKKAFYKTPEGRSCRAKLSKMTAREHSQNKFNNAKRNGWYYSKRSKKPVFFGSSYELRLCHDLDCDDTVESYETQIYFEIEDHGRCLDFLVYYKDGTIKAVEVKPKSRLDESLIVAQIADSEAYAKEQGWSFEVCTEDQLGMEYKEIRDWADAFLLSEGTGIDLVEWRKENNRQKATRHYQKRIANDKVEIFCEYCNKTHALLRKTYENNVARNGRYICGREGGSISGKHPCTSKGSGCAKDGKKQCTKCQEILDVSQFGKDKSRIDGLASRCKECRRKIANEKYQSKKRN